MFSKALIANRGEIACRLIQACRALGIGSVALYSEADRGAPWTLMADESYLLPGVAASGTYLNQKAILAIAARAGVQAIHPGYGFLSENAAFAAACAAHGFTFVGPSPEAIRLMGSKAAAREIARRAGVPVVPGVDGAGKSAVQLQQAATEIGYPVLIKASAGGGGKGMRLVQAPADFAGAVQAARNESRSAFGDDHVLLEKFFPQIHHVEVQVLGDNHGKLLHLFERECSIQRRHQKIIEESPSPTIGPALRAAITAAAVSLAQAVGYSNAGTVEFIVNEQGQFYLLEMNTRLQVEHPVTEWVTGLDIAAWQFRLAAGERLPWRQEELVQRGHALECRLYAEDPAQQFLPSTGQVALFRPPSGPGVRVDAGIVSGSVVSPYYDPMLAKVITWGADRAEAVARMVQALRQTVILGATSNIPYLLDILQQPEFVAGHTPTNFLQRTMPAWQPPPPPDELWLAVAALEALQGSDRRAPVPGQEHASPPGPWGQLPGWRNVG